MKGRLIKKNQQNYKILRDLVETRRRIKGFFAAGNENRGDSAIRRCWRSFYYPPVLVVSYAPSLCLELVASSRKSHFMATDQ